MARQLWKSAAVRPVDLRPGDVCLIEGEWRAALDVWVSATEFDPDGYPEDAARKVSAYLGMDGMWVVIRYLHEEDSLKMGESAHHISGIRAVGLVAVQVPDGLAT